MGITRNDKKDNKCITEMINCKGRSLHSVIPSVMTKVSAFYVFLQVHCLWHKIETSVCQWYAVQKNMKMCKWQTPRNQHKEKVAREINALAIDGMDPTKKNIGIRNAWKGIKTNRAARIRM
jgi:hypothetical protein